MVDKNAGSEDVDDFEVRVNEVVATYAEPNINIDEVVESSEVGNEIKPSEDDEGSSPSEVYTREPEARPETYSEEEDDQFEDLTSAGTVDDLVSKHGTSVGREGSRGDSIVIETEEEPVFVSNDIVNDDGVDAMAGDAIEIEYTHQHSTDDDSTAFVDRMELADGEDEGESTAGGYGDSLALREESNIPTHSPIDAASADGRSIAKEVSIGNQAAPETNWGSQERAVDPPTEKSSRIDVVTHRILV